jgi:hypothetical protein
MFISCTIILATTMAGTGITSSGIISAETVSAEVSTGINVLVGAGPGDPGAAGAPARVAEAARVAGADNQPRWGTAAMEANRAMGTAARLAKVVKPQLRRAARRWRRRSKPRKKRHAVDKPSDGTIANASEGFLVPAR